MRSLQRPVGANSQRAGLKLTVALAAAITAGSGCGDEPSAPPPAKCTDTNPNFSSPAPSQAVDLLLVVDNSRGMAYKQELLSLAVPELVDGLTNPPCLDAAGNEAAPPPKGPLDSCPVPGTRRAFQPILDVHVGVISSSLGGHGADACPDQETTSCASGAANTSNNDKGRLLSRTDPCGGPAIPSYQGQGFLAWDPSQELEPPGESSAATFAGALRDMVVGVGQIGCGFEAPLESWYRFLVDPEPYASITIVDNKATPAGTDDALLAQRRDFLRPGSLLSIVVLSDENDCSIVERSQFFLAAQRKNADGTPFHLPRARAECATNPNDPCCKSCGQGAGSCPADPTCVDGNGDPAPQSDAEDPPNLRCFDQKRRFGIDFLYSIERYTQALTSPSIPNRAGDLAPNPIFSDLNPGDDIYGVRDAGLVFFTAIVGVPWQGVARDKSDLSKGLKGSDEMLEKDTNGLSTWDILLGDPASYVYPMDPHMVESIAPRSGASLLTGQEMVPPGMTPTDPINGSERTIAAADDLQYTCIFPLPSPRDCSDPAEVSCDCQDPMNDSPLCAEDPAKPGSRTIQIRDKAYPGARELALVKSIDTQGVAASVCPAELDPGEASAPAFGYRPAIRAMLDRIKTTFSGACLPRTLVPDKNGQVSCVIVEALKAAPEDAAACNECKDAGRRAVQVQNKDVVTCALASPEADVAGWNCFCEIPQTEGDDLAACQDDPGDSPKNASTGAAVNGWCYVDATTTPPTGDPNIVKNCPDTEKRILRFVGAAPIKPDATSLIRCSP